MIIHQAEEGGYWAEIPAIPGCFTQGDSWEELIKNIYEAVEACLSVDVEKIKIKPSDKVLDVAIKLKPTGRPADWPTGRLY